VLLDFLLLAPFDISFLMLCCAQIIALVLDHFLGEPGRFHPLIGFGKLYAFLEKHLNKHSTARSEGILPTKICGVVAWLFALLPILWVSLLILDWLARFSGLLFWLMNIFILYLAIGHKSLKQHSHWVAKPLSEGDLDEARQKVSWLVSRQTEQMEERQITKACIESVLENGSDAVYGALFWFLIAGAPGAILYRLANTLDASWGYRNHRFKSFGWCAARMDDLLNLIPARICALCYSLCGNIWNALESWQRINRWRKTEGKGIGSPNAGIVMASGAGALNLSLGGAAVYGGERLIKPELGRGRIPDFKDISRATRLLDRSLMLFFVLQGLCLILGYSLLYAS